MATNAEAIASALAHAGVQFAFGLPGGEVAVLIEACRKADIRFFLTGHEASAAFMADVTGQITGRPGICIATLGPGAMNLSLGLANAFLDRSPVLAITAQVPKAIQKHFPHQRLPLTDVFAGICKRSIEVDGNKTADLIDRCLLLAATPPYGPVHVALPSDLGDRETTSCESPIEFAYDCSPSTEGALDEVRAMLSEAQRPLLIAGVGVLPRDVPALRQFAELTGLPYVVTPKAKGVLAEDASEFLGVIGGMALDRAVMETVDQADVLLGVGFDPVECDKPWYVGRRIANLSRACTMEGEYRPVECIGEIDEHLEMLLQHITRKSWPAELLAECKGRVRPQPLRSERGLSPLAVIRALREILPRETILTCDVGSHKYFAGQFWESYEPQTFFMSNGLSAMGYGVPAAIAAKLHFPHRPVVALVGDGGMLMMLHNLVFLRQYRVPIVVICFTDESLSLIRIAQQRRGFEPYGVDFPAPDFRKIAEGFGILAFRADLIEQLKSAVVKAEKAGQPALVDVAIGLRDYEAYC